MLPHHLLQLNVQKITLKQSGLEILAHSSMIADGLGYREIAHILTICIDQ